MAMIRLVNVLKTATPSRLRSLGKKTTTLLLFISFFLGERFCEKLHECLGHVLLEIVCVLLLLLYTWIWYE